MAPIPASEPVRFIEATSDEFNRLTSPSDGLSKFAFALITKNGAPVLLKDLKIDMDLLEAMGFDSVQIEEARKASQPGAQVEDILEVLLGSSVSSVAPPMPEGASRAMECATPLSDDNRRPTIPTGLRGDVMSLPISQYDFGYLGRSACTAVSIAAIKQQLLEIDNVKDITAILMDSIQEGVSAATNLASNMTNIEHLAVDEVWPLVPSFFECGITREAESVQALVSATEECFMELLGKALSLPAPVVGIVLTKPPVTVSILVDRRGEKTKYRLFDSHARPEYGLSSAYLITGDDLRDCAFNLKLLFPRISDQVEDLAVELSYHSFEAHFFHKT